MNEQNTANLELTIEELRHIYDATSLKDAELRKQYEKDPSESIKALLDENWRIRQKITNCLIQNFS